MRASKEMICHVESACAVKMPPSRRRRERTVVGAKIHVWFTCPVMFWFCCLLLFLDIAIPFYTAPRTDHYAAHMANTLNVST